MSVLTLNAESFAELEKAMVDYQGNTEKTINDVLHNEASPLIQDAVRRLIPESKKTWKGKKAAAVDGRSLTDVKENLSVTVKTTKQYQYLYFPDDGTNTRRHVGNQQFFQRGGESQIDEITNRCINRLTENF